MPALSARQIGTPALRLLGVAAAEQPLSADMAQSALEALNTMLDSWSVEKLLTYTRPRVSLPLVPGRATYTWGVASPACDIPRASPVRLDSAILLVDDTVPGLEWPLEVIDQLGYEEGIWIKALSSTYPSVCYLDASEPVATLYLWPVPDQGYTLRLLPWTAHAPYEHWDHVLPWPTGYQRPMIYNLAVDLGPQYGVEASPTIVHIADESKRALYPLNVEVGRLSLAPGRRRGGTPYGYPKGFLAGWG